MGLNWQSRCAVFPLENNRASVDDATETWQGDDLHRKGTTPRRKRPCCVRSCGVNPNVPPSRPRGIVELLVKPPRANTLIPFPLSFSISPFSSLRPFFFHWSLCSLLHSIPSTNSCGNPLSYSSYFTITISGSSRFSSSYRTLSLFGLLLNISALHADIFNSRERTRASTHIWSSRGLIGSFLPRLSWRLRTIAFVIVLFFINLSIAIARFWIFREFSPFSFYEII